MVESQSLRLALTTGGISDRLVRYATQRLQEQGFTGVTPATLSFLGSLDCDTNNHASEIARQLNVSRQMVAKTVKELCRVGYLEQTAGGGRRKQIYFTAQGEHLMSAARHALAALDKVVEERFGARELTTLTRSLEQLGALLDQTFEEGEPDSTAGNPPMQPLM